MREALKIHHLFQFAVLWSVVGYLFPKSLTANLGGRNTVLFINFCSLTASIFLYGFRSLSHWFIRIFSTIWQVYYVRNVISLFMFAEPVALGPPQATKQSGAPVGRHVLGALCMLRPTLLRETPLSVWPVAIELNARGLDSKNEGTRVTNGSPGACEAIIAGHYNSLISTLSAAIARQNDQTPSADAAKTVATPAVNPS